MKQHRPRQIAPRLASGASRIHWGGGLPEHIKEGIKKIARLENKSVSWVMEQVVIDYFNLARPKYKNDPEEKPHTTRPRKEDQDHGNLHTTRQPVFSDAVSKTKRHSSEAASH